MYKILIGNKGTYTFAMEKVEIKEPVTATNDVGEEVTVYIPSGKFELKPFERDDFEDVKDKYIELLNTHHMEELNIIQDCTEKVTIDVTIEEPVSDEPSAE